MVQKLSRLDNTTAMDTPTVKLKSIPSRTPCSAILAPHTPKNPEYFYACLTLYASSLWYVVPADANVKGCYEGFFMKNKSFVKLYFYA